MTSGTERALVIGELGSKLHLLLYASTLLSVELLKRVEQLPLHFLYRLHAFD